MRRAKLNFDLSGDLKNNLDGRLNSDRFHWASLSHLTTGAFVLVCLCAGAMAQQPGQKMFSSAEEASQALVTAAKCNDEKAMLDILGAEGKQIVSSGDDAEDADNRTNFVERYQEMHRLVKEAD